MIHILGAGSLKEYETISVQDDANDVKANNAEYADIAKITLILWNCNCSNLSSHLSSRNGLFQMKMLILWKDFQLCHK